MLVFVLATLLATPAASETLEGALVRAYQTNPVLNAERSRQRGTDENVSIALAGYQSADRRRIQPELDCGARSVGRRQHRVRDVARYAAQITINQILFNGYKTGNQVRQAESPGNRDARRYAASNSDFLDAATAFEMWWRRSVGRGAARQSGIFARDAREHAQAAQSGRRDADRRRASGSTSCRGTADLDAAEVNLAISQAVYEQIIGVPPGYLSSCAGPIGRLLPTARDQALAVARRENPAVLGATYDIDVAQYAIRVAESALSADFRPGLSPEYAQNTDVNLSTVKSNQAGVIGDLNIPIYDGGQQQHR